MLAFFSRKELQNYQTLAVHAKIKTDRVIYLPTDRLVLHLTKSLISKPTLAIFIAELFKIAKLSIIRQLSPLMLRISLHLFFT